MKRVAEDLSLCPKLHTSDHPEQILLPNNRYISIIDLRYWFVFALATRYQSNLKQLKVTGIFSPAFILSFWVIQNKLSPSQQIWKSKFKWKGSKFLVWMIQRECVIIWCDSSDIQIHRIFFRVTCTYSTSKIPIPIARRHLIGWQWNTSQPNGKLSYQNAGCFGKEKVSVSNKIVITDIAMKCYITTHHAH